MISGKSTAGYAAISFCDLTQIHDGQYNRAFARDSPVALILLCTSPAHTADATSELKLVPPERYAEAELFFG